jgi:cold-inducible RNA-binding protein
MASKRLYVGNLNYNTNDQALRDAFAEFGDVKDVKVIIDRETGRSKGFGFVEFANEADAQNAVTQMNGQDLDGRSLRVNEAEDRRGGGGGGGGGYGGPPRVGGGGGGGRGKKGGSRRRGRDDGDRW